MTNPRRDSGVEARRIAAEGLPAVVLVGRANAGKSTLFNRITKGGRAITSAIPGTTRDLNFARAKYGDREFVVVDSGGLELGGHERMTERIVSEALAAVGVADVVVFMLDGRGGLSEADAEALALVRETGCPLIMAVNKIDRPGQEAEASEFYALGGDELFFISAAHGRGVEELLDQVVARLPEREGAAAASPDLRLALIGRPNVGKSSLLNRLSGFERAIVDDTPGTTRDPVDVRLTSHGRDVLLIDTAGIRRPPRVEGELERHSVGRAIETIRRANVVLLVIDASEGITDQDARLARLADTSDRAMVIVCNKWDVAAKAGRKVATFVRDAHERYPFLEYATMVFTSAVTGDGVDGIIPAATQAGDSWRAVFQTSRLNRTLAEASAAMDPPQVDRRRLNLMYVTQVGSAPPRLRFFTNVERGIPAHYIRFIETRFRKALGLVGTPLRLDFRRTGRSWVQGAPPRPTRGKPRNRPAPRIKPARA
ncbi:MAG TPA: ribosome biogenesis GTPase Der [Candidatus Binatus sp.]|uniref:ribosome biogenesis GTPase Der n=1 Tax=Candidatus Binatus sp. TaxID=2811406 RepID=UPI002B45BB89|nr:ribosome biogenesis GTPase Der [Candidatus Binatus sp.]HKN14899.1 ribosome biogenesis GTPase Der [Candidatus Binatus sp.]